MQKTQNDIPDIIKFHKKFIESNSEKILSPDKKIKSRWMWGLGTNAKIIALNYLLLNNKSDAAYWFNKSVEFYMNCLKLYKKGANFGINSSFSETAALHVMKSAVFSGNKECINELAGYIIKNKPEISLKTNLIYNYVLAVSMLITDDNELCEQLKKVVESEDKYKKKIKNYFTGTAKTLEGIVENDAEKIIEGASEMLIEFNDYSTKNNELPVCEDLMMILLIARGKGIEINAPDIWGKYAPFIS